MYSFFFFQTRICTKPNSLTTKKIDWKFYYFSFYISNIHCVRKVAVNLDLWGPAKSAVYRDRPRTLNELKTVIIAFIRNILQANMQKVFAKVIKRIQACIDARERHFQHLL
jgi:hypothetical protein